MDIFSEEFAKRLQKSYEESICSIEDLAKKMESYFSLTKGLGYFQIPLNYMNSPNKVEYLTAIADSLEKRHKFTRSPTSYPGKGQYVFVYVEGHSQYYQDYTVCEPSKCTRIGINL